MSRILTKDQPASYWRIRRNTEEARLALGLSVADFVERTGCSPELIGEGVRADTLSYLQGLLDLPTASIFPGLR
jgi:hypothetical protein